MVERREWLRAYVEKLLRELGDDEAVHEDEDGDFCLRWDTAAVYVRVMDREPTMVYVFAHAAWGVKTSAALLRELNELNAQAVSATIYVREGVVHVDQTLLASSLDKDTLAQAVSHVGLVATDIGTLAAAMFDGQTPFPADAEQADAPEDSP
jgi:Putative bacterial sensory transduction regulator